jgi:glycosyltransferase involved in cell wall biosynthesis
MKVLIYWHDIFLPYSEYLIRAFDNNEEIDILTIVGPEKASSEAIFSAGEKSDQPYKKTKYEIVDTYNNRPKWCTLNAFRKVIRKTHPDKIIILDEALSVNVFNAALANRLENNNANVFFYGFENIMQTVPWRFLKKNFGKKAFKEFIRKSFRYLVFDVGLQPIRKRLVHGGLYCYDECREIINRIGWYPKMQEQWWGIQLDAFIAPIPQEEVLNVRIKAGFSKNVNIIGFVGRFIEDKGLLDLIKVLQLMDEDTHLLFIGAGPLQERIEREAKRLGLSGRLHIMPPKTQHDLASLYRIMNVLVLPSRTGWFWKEQYGRVLVEAMACGVPVVGSDSGAIPYVIGDCKCIHKEGNAESIKEAIDYALALPKNNADKLVKRALQGDISRFVNAFIKS